MPSPDTVDDIKTYIATKILDGEDVGELDGSTPLLDLGILNSMELMGLIAHIEATHNVKVPGDGIVPDNFQSIDDIAHYIETLRQAA